MPIRPPATKVPVHQIKVPHECCRSDISASRSEAERTAGALRPDNTAAVAATERLCTAYPSKGLPYVELVNERVGTAAAAKKYTRPAADRPTVSKAYTYERRDQKR